VIDVRLDRALADEELGGDLAVGLALADEREDLKLAARKTVRMPSAKRVPWTCRVTGRARKRCARPGPQGLGPVNWPEIAVRPGDRPVTLPT
jgi:hypothetical protein